MKKKNASIVLEIDTEEVLKMYKRLAKNYPNYRKKIRIVMGDNYYK